MAVTPLPSGPSDAELDCLAGVDPGIVPSSGFSTGVMERIRAEAIALPPIPFPWKRALPGMAVVAGALVVAAVNGSGQGSEAAPSLEMSLSALDPALALALTVAVGSCAVPFLVARGHALVASLFYGASSRSGRPLP